MSDHTHTYFATCPKGVERLLAEELRALGAASVRPQRAGVAFAGPLETGYRACLWSRVASRVLLKLAEFPAPTPDALYDGVRSLPWEEHLRVEGTLAVDAVSSASAVSHTQFAALKTKDAIVDRFRDLSGARPNVDVVRPDLRVNVSIRRDRATVSLDLSGDSLHRRGYREAGMQAEAPLKENLAAAVLSFAGWPRIAEHGGLLADPMCGSGTLLVEGALLACDAAPGLPRDYWGFLGWRGHDAPLWIRLRAEAEARREAGLARVRERVGGEGAGGALAFGGDADPRAVSLARGNAERAGLGTLVRVERRELAEASAPEGASGLVVTNPPYGERLGRSEDLGALYALLGERLRHAYRGWTVAVLTSEPSLAARIGMRATETHTVFNGRIETGLYVYAAATVADAGAGGASTRDVAGGGAGGATGGGAGDVTAERGAPTAAPPAAAAPPIAPSPGAEMLANRLRKNLRVLGKQMRRAGVTCWRLYDADMPEYAVAIDLYAGAGPDEGELWAHVAEYAPPASIDPEAAQARLSDVMGVVPDVLGIPASRVALKVRQRQRGTAQYEKRGKAGRFMQVAEQDQLFLVNLTDYLDTGLFLDHRLTRAMLRDEAAGRRFLNLFAYTGAASVYAATGGARTTTSVDLSATYLEWAGRNLALNGSEAAEDAGRGATGASGHGAPPQHRLVRADVLEWLGEEKERVAAGWAEPYGLVFLDPPSFSNSKRMGDRTFDVQRDHVWLLREAAELLAPGGLLVFSNNFRKFKMDAESLPELEIVDITAETIPPDFARNPRIHNCWRITERMG